MDNIIEARNNHILLFVGIGLLIFVLFYIIDKYIFPLSKISEDIKSKYWVKIQILIWIGFFGLFYIELFYSYLYVTLTFTALIVGLGWSYWRNVFAGIIIKFNNQLKIGETISTDFVTGELRSINFSQSEFNNQKGELVIIPNHKLRTSVLKHLYEKSNIQTHSFKVRVEGNQSSKSIYNLAINCPYIAVNQKIEVEQINSDEFVVKAALVDSSLVDRVNRYFLDVLG